MKAQSGPKERWEGSSSPQTRKGWERGRDSWGPETGGAPERGKTSSHSCVAFLEALPKTSFPGKLRKSRADAFPGTSVSLGLGPCQCPLFPGNLLTLTGKGEGRREKSW